MATGEERGPDGRLEESWLGFDPINRIEDDELDIEPFVDSIVQRIDGVQSRSTVFSLQGAWGSGKTSCMDLAEPRLKARGWDVIRLRPWAWSAQETLGKRFFEELAAEEPKKHRGGLLNFASKLDYAPVKEGLSKFVKSSVPVIVQGSLPLSALALVVAIADAQLKIYFTIAAVILLVAVTLFQAILTFREHIATGGDADTYGYLKRKLTEQLARNESRRLVVLDDIDRLTPKQVLEICQLVKENLAIDRVHFLLCFDRPTVEAMLRKPLGQGPAASYLGKIVQFPFLIPLITPDQLDRALDRRLALVLGDRFSEIRSSSRYQTLLARGFMNSCETLRDIKEVVAHFLAVRDSLRLSGADNALDDIDLLALCLLEVRDPAGYEMLKKRFIEEDTTNQTFLELASHLGRIETFIDAFVGGGNYSLRHLILSSVFGKTTNSDKVLFATTGRELEGRNRFADPNATEAYLRKSGSSLIDPQLVLTAWAAGEQKPRREAIRKLHERGQLRHLGAALAEEVQEESLVLGLDVLEDLIFYATTLTWTPSALGSHRGQSGFEGSSSIEAAIRSYFRKEGDLTRHNQLTEVLRFTAPLLKKIDLISSVGVVREGDTRRLGDAYHVAAAVIRADILAWLGQAENYSLDEFDHVIFRAREFYGVPQVSSVVGGVLESTPTAAEAMVRALIPDIANRYEGGESSLRGIARIVGIDKLFGIVAELPGFNSEKGLRGRALQIIQKAGEVE